MPSKKYGSYKEDFEREKWRARKKKFIRLVLFCAFLGTALVVLLFFAHLFDIRKISITSTELIPTSSVEQIAWDVLDRRILGIPRKNNSILFSPHRIASELENKIPRIDSVTIRRISLHEIGIQVTERIPIGLWCLETKTICYYYDDHGIAFSEVTSTSGFLFVAMRDARNREIILGEEVAPAEILMRLQDIKKLLQFGGISIRSFHIYPDTPDELTVTTGEGWRILYLNDDSTISQTNSLLAFLKESISANTRKNLDYVDLRIIDRIYYKQK